VPDYVAARLPELQRVLPALTPAALPLWLAVHREIRGNRLIRSSFDRLAELIPEGLSNQGRIGG